MLPTNPLLNATTPAGPHLPVGLLRQYVAGTLASAAQHRVEAHTLACTRCADILAGLQQTSPATTDQALTQLQQRLRQRVQQQAAPARYDHEARRNYWLIPQLAAAAALLLGLVAGGWWAWQQRYSSPAASIPAVATSAPPVAPSPEERSAKSTASPLAVPEASNAPLASSARVQASHRPVAARARSAQRPAASPPALLLDTASTAPKTQEIPVAAAAPSAAAPAANASVPVDSARLAGRISGVALSRKQTALYEAAPLRETAMPAAPKLPPTPVGGYSALREKLRREATEFKPEFPEQPLSGTVQLRITIGPDGKIQQLKVLRGLRDDYDEEAQRLLCDGPGWIPGISGGKRAPLEIDIAVPF